MKKSVIIGIIIVIVIIIIAFFVVYFNLSSPKEFSQDELEKNPSLCNTDADCHVQFTHCGCENICTNNFVELTDCSVECRTDRTTLPVKDCQCKNNKCIPK